MTTIVSLAARDFIAVGCDSLATTSADLVYPSEITSVYFDSNGNLKLDALGKPLLQRATQIWEKAKSKPIDQLPNVTKLYDLHPFRACVLFAGTSRIGDTTIGHIVDTFLAQREVRNRKSTYTIGWLAQRFTDHVIKVYEKEIPIPWARPMSEVILSGYSAKHRLPELWRILFSFNRTTAKFTGNPTNTIPRGEFNVIFGGQYDVIQRVVNGIDWDSFCSLKQRTEGILKDYHDEMQAYIHAKDPSLDLPTPGFSDKRFNIFEIDSGGVTRLFPDVGSLSEQAGIDFVHFLIDVMIKAQKFATSIPTVGGNIHVGLLTKNEQLRWISEEGFTFEHKHIPKFQHA